VVEQNVDHCVWRLVVGCIEPELFEILVLSDQFDRLNGKQACDLFERAPVGRLLDVFDDVELDASLAQDFQRGARLASGRVVVELPGRHGIPPVFNSDLLSLVGAEHSNRGLAGCGPDAWSFRYFSPAPYR
jgi:hypothetical protein